jgi:ribosomal protein S7
MSDPNAEEVLLRQIADLKKDADDRLALARLIQQGRDDNPTTEVLTLSVGGHSLPVPTEVARDIQRGLVDDSRWLRRAAKDQMDVVQKLRPDLIMKE